MKKYKKEIGKPIEDINDILSQLHEYGCVRLYTKNKKHIIIALAGENIYNLFDSYDILVPFDKSLYPYWDSDDSPEEESYYDVPKEKLIDILNSVPVKRYKFGIRS